MLKKFLIVEFEKLNTIQKISWGLYSINGSNNSKKTIFTFKEMQIWTETDLNTITHIFEKALFKYELFLI